MWGRCGRVYGVRVEIVGKSVLGCGRCKGSPLIFLHLLHISPYTHPTPLPTLTDTSLLIPPLTRHVSPYFSTFTSDLLTLSHTFPYPSHLFPHLPSPTQTSFPPSSDTFPTLTSHTSPQPSLLLQHFPILPILYLLPIPKFFSFTAKLIPQSSGLESRNSL